MYENMPDGSCFIFLWVKGEAYEGGGVSFTVEVECDCLSIFDMNGKVNVLIFQANTEGETRSWGGFHRVVTTDSG